MEDYLTYSEPILCFPWLLVVVIGGLAYDYAKNSEATISDGFLSGPETSRSGETHTYSFEANINGGNSTVGASRRGTWEIKVTISEGTQRASLVTARLLRGTWIRDVGIDVDITVEFEGTDGDVTITAELIAKADNGNIDDRLTRNKSVELQN